MAPPPFPAPLVVVGLSVFATIFTEVLTLVLVASSSTYKRLVADIDRAAKELEKLQAVGASSTAAQKKRERALDVQLTHYSRDFYMWRMRSYVVMMVVLAAMFYVLKTWYVGKSVGQLPFVPMFPFSKMAYQWLESPAGTDMSFMFLYVLSNMGIKPNVSKLMGTQLPATVSKATDMSNLTARFSKLMGAKTA
ncbi:hypothetical protein CHLRE_03g182900v5 [Chlamydomonas reinhardtii]|uniref:Uncharacterized protein n=1 Tax=Chlamydomonas reinhardtii TaxID=3055 RepID=A8JH74_CHLRE|nr:uncharacterized protein CHLRE_03g182900v5 [Chlamydomonas reinhardtii]PNW85363.1 hypothetical protein CHLRE_03g182900v5 [Chlamydomonas reinhardtii]|eukprot:XP_001702921.1 predicted protein [Chlamydomonas reinhardtii]